MTPAVLITSNFASDTGFAWKFFHKIFNALARHLHDHGLNIVLSFAEIRGQVTVLDSNIPFRAFTFDPLNISLRGIIALRRGIKEHGVRYAYLTDFPTWHWIFPLMRLWGVSTLVVHSHISVPDPAPSVAI